MKTMNAQDAASEMDAVIAHITAEGGRNVEAMETNGRALLALLGEGDLGIVRISSDDYDGLRFHLAEGIITYHPVHLFKVRQLTVGGWDKTVGGAVATPEEAIAAYRDEAAPATRKGVADKEEGRRKKLERKEVRIAADDAVIKAYEALPEEARTTFKTIIDYLALAERLSDKGPFRGPPPVANAIAFRIGEVEKDGLGKRDKAYDHDMWNDID